MLLLDAVDVRVDAVRAVRRPTEDEGVVRPATLEVQRFGAGVVLDDRARLGDQPPAVQSATC